MIERTLVMIKPDAVQRGLIGKITERFENAGFKIVGIKMFWADEDFAKKHYTEDVAKRRGKVVRDRCVNFLKEGPVVAMVIEGSSAIENVRKITGETEPRKAVPGTIRGDLCHVSYAYCDKKGEVVRNLIHASANKKDAEIEVKLWFSDSELYDYKTVHEKYTV